MTATSTRAAAVRHPLARLTADEIDTVRDQIADAGMITNTTRFVFIELEEPDKGDVLSWRPGVEMDRRVRVLLLDRATGVARDLSVSLTRGAVARDVVIDAATEGQVPLLVEEFMELDALVAADERWAAALARRGLAVAEVRCAPLSAGMYGLSEEVGRRLIRVLPFHQPDPQDNPMAHPVDGLVGVIDLTAGVVTAVHDLLDLPVPSERGRWDAPPHAVEPRTDIKPIEITQPEGPSFLVVDDEVSWAGWRFRIGFDAREGLSLHQLTHDGRSVVYRASIAEMIVPYADPSPARYWQNYFDGSEYLFGRFANSLDLGCDCLGEIHYFDATLADEMGHPQVIRNAICLHEEDFGLLWKHSDLWFDMAETRRQRRLVISFVTTVGNYDYGFYWYLYLDGRIQVEVKATGVLWTSSYRGVDHPYATEVAPGLGAPFHQHLFSARLDMAVDGTANSVYEVDAAPDAVGGVNPFGNGFRRRMTPLSRESEAQRMADPSVDRMWQVVNPSVTNRLGQPVGYVLIPEGKPVLLADESSSIHERAGFATRHLWVTQYDPAQRHPAGDLVNQHAGAGGLPVFVAGDRPLEDQDVVLWHTFGMVHFPRPEEWPVMPVDSCGFTLAPVGFFDRNPALDIPRPATAHCEHSTHGSE
jgi:primary-amine oxidase